MEPITNKPNEVYLVKFANPYEPVLLHQNEDLQEALNFAEDKALQTTKYYPGLIITKDNTEKEQLYRELVNFKIAGDVMLPPTDIEEDTFDIVWHPNPILKEKAAEVTEEEIGDVEIFQKLVARMLITMYTARGVGLAGPQIGLSKQIFVMDENWLDTGKLNPEVMVNPIITFEDIEDTTYEKEGCLSVPGGFHSEVKRPNYILLSYRNIQGEEKTISAEGFSAKVIKHEMDHLEGKLFLDYLSRLKKDMYVRKVKKAKRLAKKRAKMIVENETLKNSYLLAQNSELQMLKR